MGLLWYKINKKGIFSGTKSTKRDLGGTKSITRDFSGTKSTKGTYVVQNQQKAN